MNLRSPLLWAIVTFGIVLVLGAAALAGSREKSDEPVSATEWANAVCGSVAVWRGELETIANDFRSPGQLHADATREDRRGSIRLAVERTVTATDTLVQGIESAGVPETPEGQQAADEIEAWADTAHTNLEDSLAALEDTGDEPQEKLEALGATTGAVVETLVAGVETLVGAAGLDAQLGAAFADAETCRSFTEEEGA
jgi:hypothetical protein